MSRILTSKAAVALQAILYILAPAVVAGRPPESPDFIGPAELLKVLSPQVQYVDEEYLEKSSGYNVFGDVKVNVRRQSVMNKTRIWPGGVVPYVLDKTYSPDIRGNLEAAMREIENNTGNSSHPCIQFVPRTTEVYYVDIQKGQGCKSVIGLDYTGPQISTLAEPCFRKGVVMHELLHTLGLYHEQDRYDRPDYVSFNASNMQSGADFNFVIRNRSDIDTLGTPYDFTSIMHYGPYNFARDQRYPVMTPKPEYASGSWMGQQLALSSLDVLRVQRLYHCPEDLSHLVSDISEGNRLAWCDFEKGLCNFSVQVNVTEKEMVGSVDEDTSDAVENGAAYWITTSHPTPDGPKGGSTNGLDPFFYASTKFIDKITVPDTTGPRVEKVVSSHNKTDTTPTNATVSLKTPVLITDIYGICIDLRVYQKGPGSYWDLYIIGPRFARLMVASSEGSYKDNWVLLRYSLGVPAGVEFQLELVSVLDDGSVALDDVHILKHTCQ